MAKRKKILVASLNWGLGHATRCIPIIKKLIDNDCEVIIASDGGALNLLKKEFPDLQHVELPGYNINYSRRFTSLHMLKLLPRIYRAIRKEKKSVEKIIFDQNIDVIISDNRYGCYDPRIKSIFLSHQLSIPLNKIISPIINTIHHSLINVFDEIWVPDIKMENISGKMSQGKFKNPKSFIGILSRFEKYKQIQEKDQIVCILSGPEPHRADLEKILIGQLKEINLPSTIIRGVVSDTAPIIKIENNLTIVNYMIGDELSKLIQESKIVIMRCGYSSIMDLIKLKKKAILIPTPNQPEQLYLGMRLQEKSWAVIQDQRNLNLRNGISKLISLKPFQLNSDNLLDRGINAL